jgi:hypothetical protein
MDLFFENLKRDVESNPLVALGVAAGLLTAAGKFVDAAGSVKSKRAYAKMAEKAAKKAARK